MNAWELKANQKGRIKWVEDLSPTIQQRLIDLGFAVGETILCVKIPPFNGPRMFQNSHGIYSIEQEVARCIGVEI
ncbi:MAG: ferrous iron transport protein A [Bdellovibrionales bacterium]|nr:ferrous iron transport protein A [Bdellovibrionales bacterium]